MPELTVAADLAWRIAALEAQRGQAAALGPDHLLVALLSLDKLLEPAAELDAVRREAVRLEQATLLRVLAAAGLDATATRRAIREQIPSGRAAGRAGAPSVPQRDEACLAAFRLADARAERRGDLQCGTLDLLVALLERPSPSVLAAIGDLARLRRHAEMAQAAGMASVVSPAATVPPTASPSPVILPPPVASSVTSAAAVPPMSGPPAASSGEPPASVLPPATVSPFDPGMKPSPPTAPPPGPTVPAVLLRHGRDLTAEAEAGRLPPVVGRHEEMLQVARVLRRRTKNAPVLVGEAGVGKTAVVEGLARLIAEGAALVGRRIVALSVASLVAGTSYRGQFEERLEEIVAAVRSHPEIVLFLDEIHSIVGAGDADGRLDAAGILKPALARGEIACIGATTLDEYQRHIASDPALERRFQPVLVAEPGPADALAILEGLRADLEEHHGVRIEPDALEVAVDLTVRHVPNRRLPDKAVDALDEACSRASMPSLTAPAPGSPSHAGVRSAGDAADSPADGGDGARPTVTRETVAAVVAAWTGLPSAQLGHEGVGRSPAMPPLADLEGWLGARIVGQDAAIRRVAERVRLARADLGDSERPAAVLLFVGPGGVGKAALAEALADALGAEMPRLRLDVRGPVDAVHVADPLRRQPRAVILLEGIGQSAPDAIDALLPLLGTGRLPDSRGRTVDARQAIFVLTVDLDPAAAGRRAFGFGGGAGQDSAPADLRNRVSPDLLRLADEVVLFRPLAEPDFLELARRQVAVLGRRLLDRHGIELTVSEEGLALLARRAFAGDGAGVTAGGSGGAGTIERVVARLLAEPLSREILAERVASGARLRAVLVGKDFTFHSTSSEP